MALSHYFEVLKEPSQALGVPICNSMGLVVVVIVVRGGTNGGLSGGGGGRGKVGWVVIGVGEGGVGTQGRVRLAKSECKRSRVLSCSSWVWTSMSRSRNGGSSSEGEDSEVESMGSSVLSSPQWGFTGGGQWRMMMAYLMVAVGEVC